MTQVFYQPAAEKDLIAVWLAVADDLGSAEADKYLNKIVELCELIATQPEMGPERIDVAEGVRAFPIDRYVVFYEARHGELRILRIWHSAQDPKSLNV
ncbi:MAG: type II toxin-antitoxin system RelE/ParE family toxin [Pseudomonadota bacterium]